MSYSLFVYGTLMFEEVYTAVIGTSPRSCIDASLKDFRRYAITNPSVPYPAIIQEKGFSVQGKLIQEVSYDALQILDVFEEVSDGLYQRTWVEVQHESVMIPAVTYVAGPQLRTGLDGAWCPEAFKEKHLQAYLLKIES